MGVSDLVQLGMLGLLERSVQALPVFNLEGHGGGNSYTTV